MRPVFPWVKVHGEARNVNQLFEYEYSVLLEEELGGQITINSKVTGAAAWEFESNYTRVQWDWSTRQR